MNDGNAGTPVSSQHQDVEMLRFHRACERFDIGRTKLRDLINEGLIDAYKLDGMTYVNVASARAYFASLPRYQAGRKVADNKRAA